MDDPTGNSVPSTSTCFVIMGFGKKTDFETSRVLDLDQSYLNLIKPAVEAAGLKCIRADEIVHSGLIDVPMYELLLKADVVVADISTSNRNAIYELGVRHALRPYATVVVAEEMMMKSPFFDLNHIVIRKYRHLGEDIGVNEARRFTGDLTSAIKTILAKDTGVRQDSPVYQYIARLTPPAVTEAVEAAVSVAKSLASGDSEQASSPPDDQTHRALMQMVDETQKKGDFTGAKFLLEKIRAMRLAKPVQKAAGQAGVQTEDPYILQRLALATYKSKLPTELDSLNQARDLLALLEPQTSNDTETLGLSGAVQKRLWNLTKETKYLDEAVRAYERGFYLRNDYYNGINFAFLLNVRAKNSVGAAEAIADFVQARRVRAEVIDICKQWLSDNLPPKDANLASPDSEKYQENKYWVVATLAEASLGIGDEAGFQEWRQKIDSTRPKSWMLDSTLKQMDDLRSLLVPSPLDLIKVDAASQEQP